MSRRRALLLLVAGPLALAQAQAQQPQQPQQPRLVPALSHRNIEIHYSFSGAELLLFGAIVYPRGRVPEERTDIAVVLKGPMEPIVVREKQKVAGIWTNVGRVRFRSAPSFYAVASSRPLRRIIDDRTAAIYELGLENLQLSPGGGVQPEVLRRFEAGLIDLRRRNLLYIEHPEGVEISERVLYSARIDIPARVPVGTYTAETFLIQNRRVIAAAAREIRIEKLGFEGFVARAAERWSFAYGVVAVILSLLLGWGASAIFRRG